MMARPQQQLIVFVMLLGVLVAVYVRAFRNPAGGSSTSPSSVPAESAAPSAALELPVAVPSVQRDAQRDRARALTWSRDPFTRGASAGEGSGLALSGILWDPTHPMAIINGTTVHVGDEFEGYRILDIALDHVSVSDGTNTFQLLIVP